MNEHQGSIQELKILNFETFQNPNNPKNVKVYDYKGIPKPNFTSPQLQPIKPPSWFFEKNKNIKNITLVKSPNNRAELLFQNDFNNDLVKINLQTGQKSVLNSNFDLNSSLKTYPEFQKLPITLCKKYTTWHNNFTSIGVVDL